MLHPDVHGDVHHFGRLRAMEHVWVSAFQKHAKRLKLMTLNISAMSDARSDVRTPGSECDRFCWPGLPHMWAEMTLRLLEQAVYGASDGLHDKSYW